MRLAAFVITFDRPDWVGTWLQRLLEQSRRPDHILVVDNGSDPRTASVARAHDPALVSYHHMGRNAGPAGAAAYAFARLVGEGYDWILWGDDDNPPLTDDTLARLERVAATADATVGAVTGGGRRWNWKTGRAGYLRDGELTGLLEVDVFAGGSNAMVAAHAVRKAGLPRAELFFGYEDFEYALRLRQAGLRILLLGDLYRERRRAAATQPHLTGQRGERRPASALWREYYSVRNYVLMMRETFARPDLARRRTARALTRACASVVRGPGYAARLLPLVVRGVLDGYRGRTGIVVAPTTKRYS